MSDNRERDHSEFQHDLAALCHELHGAASWLAEHPEYATDERLAETFRDYAARIAARIAAWDEREEASSAVRRTAASNRA